MIPADAPVLSAVGLAYAGYRRVHRRSSRSVAPFDGAALADRFAELCAEAEAEFAATGLAGPLRLDRWLELRYRRQTHRLSVPLGGSDIAAAITTITADFERAYERTFGPGTGYAAAGIEATGLGLLATATGPAGPAGPSAVLSAAEPGPPVSQRPPTAPRGRRRVWFDGWIDTPVHTGSSLPAGAVVEGPAVIDWPATTLVVHPGQSAVAGSDGQVRLELGPRVGR
jgi:N-methylhydantoinase A